MKTFPIGKFLGQWPRTRWAGPLNYHYVPDGEPTFRFLRSTGQIIQPDEMDTDGGSIPRLFWSVEFLNPWEYFPAYLLHDWLYVLHHAGDARALTFEETNNVLAEAICTLVADGVTPAGRYTVDAIYGAVNGLPGKLAWETSVADVQKHFGIDLLRAGEYQIKSEITKGLATCGHFSNQLAENCWDRVKRLIAKG